VYTDAVLRRTDRGVFAGETFVVFVTGLRDHVERLVLVGRVAPDGEADHYRLRDDIDVVGLPHYASLADSAAVLRSGAASLRAFWRALDEVDVAWLLGPHPLALAFALAALVRRRRVVLGVRQDMPRYVARRHPSSRALRLLAVLLERGFRALARSCPVIAVGPELARHYGAARELLELRVSLVRERDIAPPQAMEARDYDGSLQLLSVGRLDTEKNPLLLADVLAELRRRDPRWRLVVCGEGPLEAALGERLRTLGVERHAELRGYLPLDDGLVDLYRQSHAFLHVSWTEGVPQVLFEAFAARVPVVATDVGGVAEVVGDAALVIPPGSASAAAQALQRVAADAGLRQRLTEAGAARARRVSLDEEARRVAAFLAGGSAALAHRDTGVYDQPMAGEPDSGVREDVATAAYFDAHVPEYSIKRLAHVAGFLDRHAGPGSSLIDLGCGTGNTLEHLQASTPPAIVAGLDVSARCLERTRQRLGCATYQGSIYDPGIVDAIEDRFDFALLSAVLHHLIGRTRTESRRYARLALQNAARLLRPGGHLLVVEPIFYPSRAMDAVFHVKKATSRLTTRRIPVLGYWNNIGAPVVSYYTNEQLADMVTSVGGLTIVERHIDPAPPAPFVGRIIRKTDTTLIARLDA
jgi:glycosyltransferase involved in cell wall biosynthesis/SAM-dependent methyltransferase